MSTFIGLDLGRLGARVAPSPAPAQGELPKKAELVERAGAMGIKVLSRATKQQIARLIEEATA